MAQHWVELMQLLHALQQFANDGLEVLEVLYLGPELLVSGNQFPLLLNVGVGQNGDIHHQVLALGKELMQRRVERADDHGESVHGFEQAREIGALHGQELQQCLPPRLLVARQNHVLHVLDAALGEEHVLRAAQTDAFRAKLARRFRVAGNIRIGAHAETAAKLIGPFHERFQGSGRRVGIERIGLPGENLTGGAVERKPVAFLQINGLALKSYRDLFLVLIHREGFRAGHAGGAHAAANHRRVAGHSAARRENALGDFHAVNVVRNGLFADQNDRRFGG